MAWVLLNGRQEGSTVGDWNAQNITVTDLDTDSESVTVICPDYRAAYYQDARLLNSSSTFHFKTKIDVAHRWDVTQKCFHFFNSSVPK